jgi:hypothetical protein
MRPYGFFLAFLIMRGIEPLSAPLTTALGAALHATITFGLATTTMLLVADLATISEVPQFRQLLLFTVYFVGLLAVSMLLFAMYFGLGDKSPDKSLQHPVLYQYALPILASWAAYGTTLRRHPSR